MQIRLLPLSLISSICLLSAPNWAQQDYELDHLGAFGGTKSFAMDINDAGYVVGYSEKEFPAGSQFYAWQLEDGIDVDVPSLGGLNNWAFGTNNSQQVVGQVDYGVDFNGQWSPGLYPTVSDLWLDTDTVQLPGIFRTFGRPEAINDHGVAAGVAWSYEVTGLVHEFHGALWKDGQAMELPTLGGSWSTAFDINNHGQVAMGAKDVHETMRAAIWDSGVITQLPDLGFGGGARAINDHGTVAGWVFNANFKEQAAYWDDHGLHVIGTLGGNSSWARDINNDGVIVGQSGWAVGGGQGTHAFIFENGVLHDLNTLNLGTHNFETLTVARSINDVGQIVGWGSTVGGYTRAWIAHPQKFRIHGMAGAVADGKQHTMKVEGAYPSSTVYLYWSRFWGSAVLNGLHTEMDIPKPLRVNYTDALGHGYLGALYPPPGAADLNVIVQAINIEPGQAPQASNALSFSFRP